MANETTEQDVLGWDENQGKLPGMLNVLTILTFVGSGFGLIGSFYSFGNAQKNYDNMPDMLSKVENGPEFAKKMMGPHPLELAKVSLDNKLPILILSLVAYALCIYGAIQMRKRIKTGFWIYSIGEIVVPIITTAFFIGFGLLGSTAIAFSIFLPLLFIVLYATQLKNLK